MNISKTKFRLNGLPYTLLKRNEVVALFGIGGEHTPVIKNGRITRMIWLGNWGVDMQTL